MDVSDKFCVRNRLDFFLKLHGDYASIFLICPVLGSRTQVPDPDDLELHGLTFRAGVGG